jgi:glucokinase
MYIVADIGGTNARMELYHRIKGNSSGFIEPSFRKVYDTADIPSISALIRTFVIESGLESPVKLLVCGIPGDVENNTVGMLELSLP